MCCANNPGREREVLRHGLLAFAALLALLALPRDAAAQRPQGAAQPGRPAAAELELVYEREVFTYRGAARRDPFVPLTSADQTGPRFETLDLRGIIYSPDPRSSVVLLGETGGRIHRARVGDVVGNATVIEIGPLRVVFAVENFGSIRQEMLELQRNQGAIR